MSTSTLPSHRAFVTRLLNSIPSLQQCDVSADSSPLGSAPEAVKKQLVSLQVLFPNEYLPALDLLDRKLITRFLIGAEEPPTASTSSSDTTHNAATSTPDTQPQDSAATTIDIVPGSPRSTADTVHYVRSAQQRPSRFSTSYESTITYEVRLNAWNCTCPAFAFAAFPAVHSEAALPAFTPRSRSLTISNSCGENIDAEKGGGVAWVFGGVSLGEDVPPVCKHLLACVLVERCKGVFGECVEEKRVSVETAAGWAAGWGDS